MEAVIKSAGSAASRKTKSRRPRSREVPRLVAIRLPSRCQGASLDLGPLDLVFLEAALAADFITGSRSKQRIPRTSQCPRKVSPYHYEKSKPSKTVQSSFKTLHKVLPGFKIPKKVPKYAKGVRNFPNPSKPQKSKNTRGTCIQITDF